MSKSNTPSDAYLQKSRTALKRLSRATTLTGVLVFSSIGMFGWSSFEGAALYSAKFGASAVLLFAGLVSLSVARRRLAEMRELLAQPSKQ